MTHYKVIAGLGNPGSKYEGTRHNIGFELVDSLFERLGGSSKLRWSERDGAMVAQAQIEQERVWLVKPLSFMNLSGEPIRALLGFFKVLVGELIVVHDDVDLMLGSVRLKQGGGDAGHNGLRSITASLGSADYARVRIGVGRPLDSRHEISDWVLGRFSSEERLVLEGTIAQGCDAVEALVRNGMKTTQNRFN